MGQMISLLRHSKMRPRPQSKRHINQIRIKSFRSAKLSRYLRYRTREISTGINQKDTLPEPHKKPFQSGKLLPTVPNKRNKYW